MGKGLRSKGGEEMTPIELLQEKLAEYERALHKSFESFKKGEITQELHNTRKKNLEPSIFEYKQAIDLLKTWKP